MFCPKCAAELVRQDGELKCLAGDMALSRHVERLFLDRYENHMASPHKGAQSIGSDLWYCPGCGVLLNSELLCPQCHLSLRDVQHQLNEGHPHKTRDGTWR
jgi:rubrerythrin